MARVRLDGLTPTETRTTVDHDRMLRVWSILSSADLTSIAFGMADLAWYGGGTRQVETTTGAARWYQKGHGVVPLRWVFVRDATGTHRDEFFFSTDTALTVERVIGSATLPRFALAKEHAICWRRDCGTTKVARTGGMG